MLRLRTSRGIIASIILVSLLFSLLPTVALADGPSDLLNDVYLDMKSGKDAADGTDPSKAVQTFEKAKSLLAKNGTIHFLNGIELENIKDEIWSLPENEFGTAKILIDENAVTVQVNQKLTLTDIAIVGPNKALPDDNPLFFIGSNGELTLGSGAVFTNFASPVARISVGGAVVLDGGVIKDSKSTGSNPGLIYHKGTAKSKLIIKSGEVIPTEGIAISVNSANAASTLSFALDGNLEIGKLYQSSHGTITLASADGYKIESIKKDEIDWERGNDGVYSATIASAGNFFSSLKVMVKEAATGAKYDKNGVKVTASTDEFGAAAVDDGTGIFTISSAKTGYVIDEVKINGTPVEDENGLSEYRIDVSDWAAGEYKIEATFAYTVRYNSGLVTVSRGGAPLDSGSIIHAGDELAVTVTPPANYAVTTLTINGTSVLNELEGGSYAYTVGGFEETAKGGAEIVVKLTVGSDVRSTGIALNQTSLALTEGKNTLLTATVSPKETSDKTIIWTSSDSTVAAVSGDGRVIAVGEGEATITAEPLDKGAAPATCAVTVSAIDPNAAGDAVLSIETPEQFIAFAESVNAGKDYAGMKVVLKNDIDIDRLDLEEPIGTSEKPFRGVFDGNGCTISGFKMQKPKDQSVGLFGYMENAVIKGLTAAPPSPPPTTSTPATYINTTNSAKSAGIVVFAKNTALVNCTSKINVTIKDSLVGGILCESEGGVAIYGCTNYGALSTQKSSRAAGIVATGLGASVVNCANEGELGSWSFTAGIAGSAEYVIGCVNRGNSNGGSAASSAGISGGVKLIRDCYNAALVTTQHRSNTDSYVAGIACTNTPCLIENTYNIGSVSPDGSYSWNVGYFPFASGDYLTIINGYYLDSLVYTGTGSDGKNHADYARPNGATSKTSAELKAVSALGDGFVEDSTGLNSGYPILKWELSTAAYQVTPSFTATGENGLTVSLRGTALTSGTPFGVTASAVPELVLSMDKKYTVDQITIGSGNISLLSSEVNGDIGRYVYKISNVSADTALTITLKKQDSNAGAPSIKPVSNVSQSVIWDGESVDVSWYFGHENDSSYTIGTAAQLMGAAALVNGLVNQDCKVYYTLTQYYEAEYWNNPENKFTKVSKGTSGDNNQSTDTYHWGIENFSGKTITLSADIDMGATFAYGGWSGPNYMPLGGQYLMSRNDTRTKIGSSFCGTFDGNGHYVYNIFCDRHSTGNYGDGQSVGFIGRLGVHDSDPVDLWPSSPGVYNLGITGHIKGNRSVGGIVGKIGKTADGKAVISGCVNYASVYSTDAKGLGGIVGAGWNGGKIENSYNVGNITSTYTCPTAGISGSNEVPLQNCYNIGSIRAAADSYAMAIGSTNMGAPLIRNCWYLAGSAPGGGYYSNNKPNNSGAKSSADMKNGTFATVLGNAYMEDKNSINGGYPILEWQYKNPSSGGIIGDSGSVVKTPAKGDGKTIESTTKVSNGTATTTVTEKAVTSGIETASQAGEKGVVIIADTEGRDAPSTTVRVPKVSASEIVKAGLSLTLQASEGGRVTLTPEVLTSVTEKAAGNALEITITSETKKAAVDIISAADKLDGKNVDLDNSTVVSVTVRSGDKSITSFAGGMAIDLPVDSTKYTVGQSYKVYHISADGNVETITGICVKTDGAIYVRISVSHLSAFVVTNSKTFAGYDDVKTGDWFYDAVTYVTNKGLMTEAGNKVFLPNADMTRAMLVTVLYRMEGSPTVTAENSFVDVQSGQWYTDAVLWANANKIMEGYGNGIFGTTNSISREQIAVILYRYAKIKGYDVTKTTEVEWFTDVSTLSAWAAPSMKWAIAQGFITGTTNTTLVPTGTASRAQVATILMRFRETTGK